MSTFGVDGLVSGLDTTALITSLMQAEALPQAALKTSVSATNAVISAYQTVNARFSTLQTSAEGLGNNTVWSAVAATSSDSSVGVTADTTASAGSLSFRVTATAAGQISVSNAVPLSDPATFSGYPIEIRDSLGVTVGSVTPASGSLADVVAAINGAAATAGVKAIAVQVSPGSYRLQLTSTTVGSLSAFSLNPGFATSAGIGAPLQAATDAVVHIGPAVGGYDVTSTTNTFTGVMPGVTFTVSKKDTDVTISMAKNPNTLADKIQAFVDAANAALGEITSKASFDPVSKTGGPLLSDFAVRQLSSATLAGVSAPVSLAGPPPTMTSPAIAGIQTDRNGKLTFDRSIFLALQAADPVQAQALVQGVAAQVATVAKGATDKDVGTLTTAIQGRTDLVKNLGERITSWDDRLALRKATLQAQFTAMEVALSKMKSQSSWLAGQIAAMPATFSG